MNHSDDPKIIDLPTPECLAQIQEQIQRRLWGRVRDFQLVVHEEGLVLRGYARTYYVKQIAQHVVMETTNLPIWANEIEVC